jgi:hypothetical protein
LPKPIELPPQAIMAGLLAWLLPGAGHWVAGYRGLAAVFFAAITFPYLVGLALGGIKFSINPQENVWLFMAELGVGGYTIIGWLISNAIQVTPAQAGELRSYYPGSDVSQIYLITAGLLNLLAVLDAMSRVHYRQPTFSHEVTTVASGAAHSHSGPAAGRITPGGSGAPAKTPATLEPRA